MTEKPQSKPAQATAKSAQVLAAEGDERRLESRWNRNDRMFVETQSATPEDPNAAEVCACETVDISANGIQVLLGQPLVVGSILPLFLESADGAERYYLSGEVRWVRPGPSEGQFLVGFLLFESDQTSILEWKQSVAGMLDSDA